MIGRPKVPLVLTTPEQQALDSLAHRARTAPQVARRARIVLACARGLDNQTVAKKLRVSPQMVGRWRARFVTRRVDGLLDAPRPGAPRTITDDTVETVIVRTLETTPDGATHWSTRTLAKATGLSHGTIARIWRAFGLQPHRTKTCTLSPDPLLVEKVRDVVGLYLHPPDHALVTLEREQVMFRPGPLSRRMRELSRTRPRRRESGPRDGGADVSREVEWPDGWEPVRPGSRVDARRRSLQRQSASQGRHHRVHSSGEWVPGR